MDAVEERNAQEEHVVFMDCLGSVRIRAESKEVLEAIHPIMKILRSYAGCRPVWHLPVARYI